MLVAHSPEADCNDILREMATARDDYTTAKTATAVSIRSAVSNHHNVVVVTDAHTLSDRPHLDAASVIRHHHWVWRNLIAPKPIRIVATDELLI